MSKEESLSGIADDTKPNMGRIYDYFLGGNHNFEVDRIFAERIRENIPVAPKNCRLVRWFLGEAARILSADGFTQFMDFASGLPVEDHIHNVTPDGAKVVYSDNDSITVAYAAEILGDTPDVLYLTCDVADPGQILDSESVASFLDRKKKTAFGLNGITYFMQDDRLRHTMKVLYDWANTGDRLFLCDASYDNSDYEETSQLYAKMGNPLYWHDHEKMSRLAGQWKPIPPGFQLVEKWLRIGNTTHTAETEAHSLEDGNFYGVIFEKQ